MNTERRFDPNRKASVVNPIDLAWDRLPAGYDIATYFDIMRDVELPPGADVRIRAANLLNRLFEQGLIRAVRKRDLIRFEPEQLREDLEKLGHRQIRQFEPHWLPPEALPKARDYGEILRESCSIPDPTAPRPGQYRDPDATALKPIRSGNGVSGGIATGHGGFTVDPSSAPSIRGY